MKLRLIALPFAALYWLILMVLFKITVAAGLEDKGLWLTTQADRIHGWSWYIGNKSKLEG